MFTHMHTYAHIHWSGLVRPLWSGTLAKNKPNSGTLGMLCLIFGASGSLPTSLQNTLRLQGTALSAVGRPGMENLDATRKTEGGKKRQAKFMCPFQFAVV